MNNCPEINHSSIKNVVFGKNVKLVEPINLYDCSLGDEVFIGPFTEIQSNVIIGNRTKIQSHSFICELVKIGDDCVISHGVMFINDLFRKGKPAYGNKKLWKTTHIENNVLIGTNSTILPVSICSNVVIGAGSLVSKSINKSGVYCGNPAKFIREI